MLTLRSKQAINSIDCIGLLLSCLCVRLACACQTLSRLCFNVSFGGNTGVGLVGKAVCLPAWKVGVRVFDPRSARLIQLLKKY